MKTLLIPLDCPNCAIPLLIPAQFAGQRGRCQHCGAALVVPTDVQPIAATPSDPSIPSIPSIPPPVIPAQAGIQSKPHSRFVLYAVLSMPLLALACLVAFAAFVALVPSQRQAFMAAFNTSYQESYTRAYAATSGHPTPEPSRSFPVQTGAVTSDISGFELDGGRFVVVSTRHSPLQELHVHYCLINAWKMTPEEKATASYHWGETAWRTWRTWFLVQQPEILELHCALFESMEDAEADHHRIADVNWKSVWIGKPEYASYAKDAIRTWDPRCRDTADTCVSFYPLPDGDYAP